MRNTSVTTYKNGYRIHFDKQCCVWMVQRRENGKWTTLEEFVEQRKAVKWADEH